MVAYLHFTLLAADAACSGFPMGLARGTHCLGEMRDVEVRRGARVRVVRGPRLCEIGTAATVWSMRRVLTYLTRFRG